jgi:manganese/zinc/iron transport system substrate-binding protein
MKKNLFMQKFILITTLLVLFLASCTEKDKPETAEGSLKVVATTSIIGDALKEIGGGEVEILSVLCGPGVDPHTYVATARDIRNMQNADIVFYNGIDLEGKMSEILENLGSGKTLGVGDQVPDEKLLKNESTGKIQGVDPHVWNNPELWLIGLEAIAKKLAEKSPDKADVFLDNFENYKKEILRVDSLIKEKTKSIPEERRIIVTGHDAFNYFAHRYGYTVFTVLGISTDSEAGVKDIQRIADSVVKYNVPVAFIETMVNSKIVEALSKAVESKGGRMRISHDPLYSDALGEEPPADTYVGMLEENIELIHKELTSDE